MSTCMFVQTDLLSPVSESSNDVYYIVPSNIDYDIIRLMWLSTSADIVETTGGMNFATAAKLFLSCVILLQNTGIYVNVPSCSHIHSQMKCKLLTNDYVLR